MEGLREGGAETDRQKDRPLGVSHFGGDLDADFEGNLDFVECWNRC